MDHTPEQPLRVTIQDLRAARYCLAGTRPWFRRHGLDWQDFLARGIAAEDLRATGDALVEPVIRIAAQRVQAQVQVKVKVKVKVKVPATEARDGTA